MPEVGWAVSNYTMYVFGKEKYLKALLRFGRITPEQYEKMERFLYERFQIADIDQDFKLPLMPLEQDQIRPEEALVLTPAQDSATPVPSRAATPKNQSVSSSPDSEDVEYVSLTQLARKYNPDSPHVIQLWLQNQNTIEFLRLWEESNNPQFNRSAYNEIQSRLGDNAFTLTAKYWIEQTGSIGLQSKSGRYGGTFAHPVIAREFLTGLSPRFKLALLEMARLADAFPGRLGDGNA